MELSKDLLDVLACPACKGNVAVSENSIVCISCQLNFKIKEGIPVMLLDEAGRLATTNNIKSK